MHEKYTHGSHVVDEHIHPFIRPDAHESSGCPKRRITSAHEWTNDRLTRVEGQFDF